MAILPISISQCHSQGESRTYVSLPLISHSRSYCAINYGTGKKKTDTEGEGERERERERGREREGKRERDIA